MFDFNDDQTVGIVKVGERGQIVIPKGIRKLLEINSGDNLFVVGTKKKGIIIFKAEKIKELAKELLRKIENPENLDDK